MESINRGGSVELTIPQGQKISISSSVGTTIVYYSTFPDSPEIYYEQTRVTDSSTELGTFTGDQKIKLECLGDGLYYDVAVSPVITANPVPNIATVDNIQLNGNTISSTTGNLILTAAAGSAVVVEGISFDGGVVTGITDLSVSTLTTSGIISVDDTTDTTSGVTGSIHTDGGIGVAKAVFVGTTLTTAGIVSVDDTTQSTSTITGSIHTDGGIGVAKNLIIGGNTGINVLTPSLKLEIKSAADSSAVSIIRDGVSKTSDRALILNSTVGPYENYAGISFQTNGTERGHIIQETTGNLYIAATAALKLSATSGFDITAGILSVDDATDSTSGITGSIHTDGGLGVVKDIFCDATITGTNIAINVTPIANTRLSIHHDSVGSGSALQITGFGAGDGYGIIMRSTNDTNGLVYQRFNNSVGTQIGTIHRNAAGNIELGGHATTSGTVTAAAQTNITSVGTLTSLSVSGNVNFTHSSSNVITLVPNAYNTITHNLAISGGQIPIAINGDFVANGYTVSGIGVITSNSFTFWASGGVAAGARVNWMILKL